MRDLKKKKDLKAVFSLMSIVLFRIDILFELSLSDVYSVHTERELKHLHDGQIANSR